MKIFAVIGCNYGDEGKGLATDFLSSCSGKTLVVRHNGGAQAGHTVELLNRRFVFHELSSGSFRGADTYYADSFFPDLFKLGEEAESFYDLSGNTPKIISSGHACITTLDDVLLNMLLESLRGDKRHGSCGMGINEADLRKKAGFAVKIGQLCSMYTETLYRELKRIRTEYTSRRLQEVKVELLSLTRLTQIEQNEYFQMLMDDELLYNYADTVIQNLRYLTVIEQSKLFFEQYDTIIFEGAQGLCLDSEYKANWPHVTASRTGLTNIIRILEENNLKLDEVFYVTRSYVTKHGAGPLLNEECVLSEIEKIPDETNIENPWQGTLRYSRWDSPEELFWRIHEDGKNCPYPVKKSLLVTHLNETKNKMLFRTGDIDVRKLMESEGLKEEIDAVYLSQTKFSKDIIKATKTS